MSSFFSSTKEAALLPLITLITPVGRGVKQNLEFYGEEQMETIPRVGTDLFAFGPLFASRSSATPANAPAKLISCRERGRLVACTLAQSFPRSPRAFLVGFTGVYCNNPGLSPAEPYRPNSRATRYETASLTCVRRASDLSMSRATLPAASRFQRT